MAKKAKKVVVQEEAPQSTPIVLTSLEEEIDAIMEKASILKDRALVRIRGQNYTCMCQRIVEVIEFIKRIISQLESSARTAVA